MALQVLGFSLGNRGHRGCCFRLVICLASPVSRYFTILDAVAARDLHYIAALDLPPAAVARKGVLISILLLPAPAGALGGAGFGGDGVP